MTLTTIKRRTGGRSARVRQDVLTHALFELAEQGYTGFNIAQIAQRAHVHETTIYRRWPTREALMIETLREFTQNQLSINPTGNLRQDLICYLQAIARLLQSKIGKTLMMLAFDENLKQANLQLWQERQMLLKDIFQAAISQGQWLKSYDADLVFSEIFGPLFVHICLLQQPITHDLIEARVDFILAHQNFFKLHV